MADGQAEIRRFIQIHAGICGVLFIICSFLVFACGIAALASQHNSVLYDYPLYGCGHIFSFIGCVPWAMLTGITYLTLSCQANARKRSHRHKRMLEFQCRWSIFFILLLIATLVVLGSALSTSRRANTKVKALTIVSIVGTGVVLFLTLVWAVCFPKHHGVFGLKVTSPDKKTLLVSFKIHGGVFFFIGFHQLAWALVAFAMKKSFDVPDEAIRIVAFSIGGFLNSMLAFLASLVCSVTVSYLTKKKADWKVKTKTMLLVHRTWTLLFLAFCIAGVALFGNCFRTISGTNELGEWESNALVVASYVFSLVGNVLLGFLFLALTVLEKECTVFGIDVESKTTPTTPPPNPAPPARSTTARTTTTTATTTRTTTARSGTATTTASTSTPKTATSRTTTQATSISTVSSGRTTSTPTANGATGGNSNITDIDEIREKNRLLEQQIMLEKQLNDLRSQRTSMPEDYPPVYVREAPEVPGPAAAPPTYDEVTNYQGKN